MQLIFLIFLILLLFLIGCSNHRSEASIGTEQEVLINSIVPATEPSELSSITVTSDMTLTELFIESESTQLPPTETPVLTMTPLLSTPLPSSTIPATELPIGCDFHETAVSEISQPSDGKTTYFNHVLGLEVSYPDHLQIIEDQYLDQVYGFTLLDPSNLGRLMFRTGWLYEVTAVQLETQVQYIVNNFSTISIDRQPITIDEQTGVMLSPVPGETEGTYIYVAADENRLFELIMGLVPPDEQMQTILSSIQFHEPTLPLSCLNIPATERPSFEELPEDAK